MIDAPRDEDSRYAMLEEVRTELRGEHASLTESQLERIAELIVDIRLTRMHLSRQLANPPVLNAHVRRRGDVPDRLAMGRETAA